MALVCEYMEWCELEHTMKVYMPELNQVMSIWHTGLVLQILLSNSGMPLMQKLMIFCWPVILLGHSVPHNYDSVILFAAECIFGYHMTLLIVSFLNVQPRAYNRAELEDILGLDGESKRENPDSRPLLLTLVESFLKDEVCWRVG